MLTCPPWMETKCRQDERSRHRGQLLFIAVWAITARRLLHHQQTLERGPILLVAGASNHVRYIGGGRALHDQLEASGSVRARVAGIVRRQLLAETLVMKVAMRVAGGGQSAPPRGRHARAEQRPPARSNGSELVMPMLHGEILDQITISDENHDFEESPFCFAKWDDETAILIPKIVEEVLTKNRHFGDYGILLKMLLWTI